MMQNQQTKLAKLDESLKKQVGNIHEKLTDFKRKINTVESFSGLAVEAINQNKMQNINQSRGRTKGRYRGNPYQSQGRGRNGQSQRGFGRNSGAQSYGAEAEGICRSEEGDRRDPNISGWGIDPSAIIVGGWVTYLESVGTRRDNINHNINNPSSPQHRDPRFN